MKTILNIATVLLLAITITSAQEIEQEVEFKYIKAKYLYDTERYEDAIKACTEVIDAHGNYKDIYVMRGMAKYQMSAYMGTKKDLLAHIEKSGLSDQVVLYLGKADYQIGNTDAALSTLLLSERAGYADDQVYEFIGQIYKDKEELISACEYWQAGAQAGSAKASMYAKKYCGGVTTTSAQKSDTKPSKLDKLETPDKTENTDIDGLETTPNMSDLKNKPDDAAATPGGEPNPPTDTEEQPTSVLDKYPDEDDTPYDIDIDEDLSLTIYGQGLGKRKVLDSPNILILSDEDGTVAIDICVNPRGKVESAEFNQELSTINKKSLVSLAIRKSRDFWFEKNDYTQQCGVVLFKINGN